jgi:nitrous oxidase accessory protein NosD
MTLNGDGAGGSFGPDTFGVYNALTSPLDLGAAMGLTVSNSTITDFKNGVYLDGTTNAAINGNTIAPSSNDNACAAVFETYGTGDMVSSNYFTSTDGDRSCYGIRTDNSAGLAFTGNTIEQMYVGFGSHRDTAGATISGNIIGGGTYSTGNYRGIELREYDSGNVITDNYVRDSYDHGILERRGYNNMYVGNVITNNGWGSHEDGMTVWADNYGPVTLVNNYSRDSGQYGFEIFNAVTFQGGQVPVPPYTLVSGNTATFNDMGFSDVDSAAATYTKNTAYGNEVNGFEFYAPQGITISDNLATLNGQDGFWFAGVGSPFQPLAVMNNSATNNTGYGFFSVGEPVAGSGNTGSTNGSGPCVLVAGCSGS